MRRAATVLAIIALALVSCGDEDEPDAVGTSTTAAAGPTTTTAAQRPTTTTPPAGSTTTVPVTLECQTVGFTPATEDAASDIRATGLSCDEAEAFVEVAGRRTSSGGPPEVDVEGYHCVLTRSEQDPLPRAFYECTNDSKTVTFVRS